MSLSYKMSLLSRTRNNCFAWAESLNGPLQPLVPAGRNKGGGFPLRWWLKMSLHGLPRTLYNYTQLDSRNKMSAKISLYFQSFVWSFWFKADSNSLYCPIRKNTCCWFSFILFQSTSFKSTNCHALPMLWKYNRSWAPSTCFTTWNRKFTLCSTMKK